MMGRIAQLRVTALRKEKPIDNIQMRVEAAAGECTVSGQYGGEKGLFGVFCLPDKSSERMDTPNHMPISPRRLYRHELRCAGRR